MAPKLHVNTAQASGSELLKIATRCGFEIFHGGKHDKINTKDGKFVTLIPRQRDDLSRPTAVGIVKAMNKFGANITYT